MADYTDSKFGVGAVYPEHATETAYGRLEPLIGAQELVNRHLFGIPLVSQIKDPFTGKPSVMTPELMQDIIDGAVQQAEELIGIDIFPVKRAEKHPFDRNAYESYGYMQLQHRPATSVDQIAVTPANGQSVYTVPLEWVETAYLVRGQINIIPMTASFISGGFVPTGSAGGAFFLAIMGNRQWVPAYWQVDYTSGFPDGLVPRVVNDLVGTIAAMEILGMLAVTYARSQSHSLGIDAMSQSVSTPGPAIFQIRLGELEQKKAKLIKKLKARFGYVLFSGHL